MLLIPHIKCPPKVLGQFVKLLQSRYPRNSTYPTQYNKFSATIDAGFQTSWIKDKARRFVGPDLDPYCLERSFEIINLLEIVRLYLFFPDH